MHPKTPETTTEQRKLIDYWLKVAGSGGKGCRDEPIWAEIGKNGPKRYTLRHNERIIVDGAINAKLQDE